MIIKKELIKREIAGDTVLIPVGKTVFDSNGLFVMNKLGAFIWDLLPDAQDESSVVDAVLEEYDVAREQAERDIHDFIETLRSMEII